MYAVLTSGGKQYRVEPGSTLLIERLEADAGASVTFDRVLLVGDGDEVTVGTPVVSGATVSGTVLGAERGPKLVIFKFKQKVKYRRRTGHRQQLLRVRIDAIRANGKEAKAEGAAAGGRKAAKPKSEAAASAPERAAAKRQTSTASAAKAAKASSGKASKATGTAKASSAAKPASAAGDEKAKRSAAAKKAAATRARKKAQAEE